MVPIMCMYEYALGITYVGNVCDMSPKCHRDTTLSPNLGDTGHVARHLKTQSLFLGLSYVSGASVISLHTNTCVLVKRSVNHQADGHVRPFLHCPITKQDNGISARADHHPLQSL